MDDPKHPLTKFRDERGLTMADLGDALGVDKGTVSRWESGQRFPDRDLWPRIRELTGLGPDELANAVLALDAAE
jgi:transcriptional regulator with XRE-family HTH domain